MFIVFINIVESLFSDIFPPFVFNNIMEVPFIFSPRIFSSSAASLLITLFLSMTYIFARFWLAATNPFCI